jgi:alpha-glucoside transport system permease protein
VTSESSRVRAWGLLAPALVVLLLWWGLPLAQTTWMGFPHLDTLVRGPGRVALRNTVLWVVIVTVGATVAGLVLAWLAERWRATGWLLPIVVLPGVVAGSVVAVAWRSVLAFRPAGTGQVGLANFVLTLPGLDPVAWLTQAPLNTLLLAGALVWVQTGVAMAVLSTAIARRVPAEVREAAELDGAGPFEAFRFVTVPSIRGAIVVAAVTCAAAAVKVWDLVVVATDGLHSSQVLGTTAVDEGLRGGDPGVGSALALGMVLLLLPLGVWTLWRARSARRGREVSA